MRRDQSEEAKTSTGSFLKLLNGYTLAAGAAGMGLITCAEPAHADIVYTPANVSISTGTTYDLDLDADGLTDFRFANVPFGVFGAFLSVKSNFVVVGLGREPYALSAGAKIGNGQHFFGCSDCSPYGQIIEDVNSSSSFGYWGNVASRYLGLKFQINSQTHYGWARMSVRVNSSSLRISARITGYAYETIANKAIKAGQTKSSDVVVRNGSLGNLAAGALRGPVSPAK